MTGDRLACKGVSITAPGRAASGREILNDVSAVFRGREVALITGDTGAGKSTLLHVLACLERPASGQVVYGTDPVSRWTPAHQDRWRRQVGIVFQTGLFLEDLNALENVLIPLVPSPMSAAEATRRSREVLDRLALTQLAQAPVNQLSVGERQRVSIARALAASPKVILADEPTAHQDDRQAAGVMALLEDAALTQGAVVVMTAHDPRISGHTAISSVYRLAGGRLERRR